MNGMQNDLPMATWDAIEALRDDSIKVNKKIDDLETKFRTLQTRCNSVLAMQAQIDALLNELKIRMRGKTSELKKAAKRR